MTDQPQKPTIEELAIQHCMDLCEDLSNTLERLVKQGIHMSAYIRHDGGGRWAQLERLCSIEPTFYRRVDL